MALDPKIQAELDAAYADTNATSTKLNENSLALQEYKTLVDRAAPIEEIQAARTKYKDTGTAAVELYKKSLNSSYKIWEKLDAGTAKSEFPPGDNYLAWDNARRVALVNGNDINRILTKNSELGKALKQKIDNPPIVPVETATTPTSGSTEGNTTKTNEDVKAEQKAVDPATGTAAALSGASDDSKKASNQPPGSTKAPDASNVDTSATNQRPSGGAADSSTARMDQAGLNKGAENSKSSPSAPTVSIFQTQGDGSNLKITKQDWRIRVGLSDGISNKLFYKSSDPKVYGVMASLKDTNGVIFPYTPTVSMTHTARYGETKLTHSNYASYFYEGSEVSAISISGEFSVQSPNEGRYLLGVISFFRACTKMFFGTQDGQNGLSGNPPPLVFLNGYGKHYFPNVPCVLTSFQHSMPPEVDYIEVEPLVEAQSAGKNPFRDGASALAAGSGTTRLPTLSTISITLQPVYSRKSTHEEFNLSKFASGELLFNRGGFI
jgi:hypothetical protein